MKELQKESLAMQRTKYILAGGMKTKHDVISFFFFVINLSIFWPHPQHAEVPRPGTKPMPRPEPQQTTQDP